MHRVTNSEERSKIAKLERRNKTIMMMAYLNATKRAIAVMSSRLVFMAFGQPLLAEKKIHDRLFETEATVIRDLI